MKVICYEGKRWERVKMSSSTTKKNKRRKKKGTRKVQYQYGFDKYYNLADLQAFHKEQIEKIEKLVDDCEEAVLHEIEELKQEIEDCKNEGRRMKDSLDAAYKFRLNKLGLLADLERAAEGELKPRLENPYLDAFLNRYGTTQKAFEELLAQKNIVNISTILFALGDELRRGETDEINLGWLNAKHPPVDGTGAAHTWQEFLGPETLIQCVICDQPGAVRSGCCAQVLYCGQECADAHWDAHKQQCIG